MSGTGTGASAADANGELFHMKQWNPESWRAFPAEQQPDWPDPAALESALATLREVPPLVFAGEARSLTESLAAVTEQRGFVLQAGDCAESFDAFSANAIRDKLKVILQMAVVLTYGSGVPTVKIGRIAGQFAKPRSAPTESRDGVELPSFRGDMVNDFAFEAAARRPDPDRLVQRLPPGHVDAEPPPRVHQGRVRRPRARPRLEPRIRRRQHRGSPLRQRSLLRSSARLRFMAACGIDLDAEHQLHQVDCYTSHEALILGYEEALTRRDSLTDEWYDCSAHLLWIGERTRQLDGAHVEFLSGVGNPVGVKLGPTADPRRGRRALQPTRPGARRPDASCW